MVDYDSSEISVILSAKRSKSTPVNFTVLITDDNFVETTEKFLLTISASDPLVISAASNLSAIFEILDDDGEMYSYLQLNDDWHDKHTDQKTLVMKFIVDLISRAGDISEILIGCFIVTKLISYLEFLIIEWVLINHDCSQTELLNYYY